MLFDTDEVIFLISALETYNESPRGNLRYELQNQLVTSSVKKLENITELTHFTKQELSVMAFAMLFIINALEKSGNVVDSLTLDLFQRLIALADPGT